MWVVGVDCHKRMHAAVVVDDHGQLVDTWRGQNTPDGWQEVRAWAAGHAPDAVWGIEGSGQYGRGLAQLLVIHGSVVREVNPRLTAHQRQRSRQRSKTDHLDALAIARLVQQEPESLPQVRVDDATAVLAVQVAARDALVADLTAVRNQLHQHLVQLESVRTAPWPRLTQVSGLRQLATLAIATPNALLAAHAQQVHLLATRMLLLQDQIDVLGVAIVAGSEGWTEPLQAIVGVGPLTAGMLAAQLGSRVFATDAQVAMYAGVAPLEASSAGQVRHRLNRTGNRQLNAVIHRIALSQRRHSVQGQAYLAKKQAEGKTWREAFRCLKRLLVRVILTAWRQCQAPPLAPVPGGGVAMTGGRE